MFHLRSATRTLVCALMMLIIVSACTNRDSTQQAATTPPGGTTATDAPAAAANPTVGPTITVGPTAEPFPLEAGWWDDAICYEVFVRSFYDSDGDGVGDINGLIEKLDYINDGNPDVQQDLGATCIWLMPMMESTSYHGYDTTDYYKVEQDYGTNDDFKRLVAEAHKRGISIILDLVLNHTSVEHPWFKDAASNPNSPYRDWYIWSKDDPGYRGPWGDVAWHKSPAAAEYYYGVFWSGMPDLNYRNPAVTEEAHKISAFWLNDMGADGFRLDAIKHLIEDGLIQESTPETHAWLREYRAFLEQTKPEVYTVGEIFGADAPALDSYYPDQLDQYFVFNVGERIINAANQRATNSLMGAIERTYAGVPFQRWAPFLTNHDQNRVMSTLGNDVGKAKIAATTLLTLPGLPFVYYGEEVGMLGAKPDEQIRTPMQWSADAATGGFTTGTPWEALQPNAAEVNVAAQSDDPASLLNLYRRLIHLHTQHPALGHGNFTRIQTSDKAVAAFLRQSDAETLLVVLNFSDGDLNGVTLASEQSQLTAGAYSLEPLLGDQAGAALNVGDGGTFTDYTPLANLAAQTGYIFKLSP